MNYLQETCFQIIINKFDTNVLARVHVALYVKCIITYIFKSIFIIFFAEL